MFLNSCAKSRKKLRRFQGRNSIKTNSKRLFAILTAHGAAFTGRPVQEKIHNAFISEMEQRIESGKLRPEDHRIYWFAWCPAYQSNLCDILKENAVTVPLCETFQMFWDEIDEDNPFEGMALKCLKNPFIGPCRRRIDGLDTIIEEYNIDGAIQFATPACRQSNTAYKLIKDSLNESNSPFLLLDQDIGDPRGYSPEQTRTRLEGFIELMAS